MNPASTRRAFGAPILPGARDRRRAIAVPSKNLRPASTSSVPATRSTDSTHSSRLHAASRLSRCSEVTTDMHGEGVREDVGLKARDRPGRRSQVQRACPSLCRGRPNTPRKPRHHPPRWRRSDRRRCSPRARPSGTEGCRGHPGQTSHFRDFAGIGRFETRQQIESSRVSKLLDQPEHSCPDAGDRKRLLG